MIHLICVAEDDWTVHGTPSTSTSTTCPVIPQPLIVSSWPPAREPKAGLISSILGSTLTYQQSSPAKLQWSADSRMTELPVRYLATGVSDLEGSVSAPTVTVKAVPYSAHLFLVDAVIRSMSVLKLPILISSTGLLFWVRPLLPVLAAQFVMVRNWISWPA